MGKKDEDKKTADSGSSESPKDHYSIAPFGKEDTSRGCRTTLREHRTHWWMQLKMQRLRRSSALFFARSLACELLKLRSLTRSQDWKHKPSTSITTITTTEKRILWST